MTDPPTKPQRTLSLGTIMMKLSPRGMSPTLPMPKADQRAICNTSSHEEEDDDDCLMPPISEELRVGFRNFEISKPTLSKQGSNRSSLKSSLRYSTASSSCSTSTRRITLMPSSPQQQEQDTSGRRQKIRFSGNLVHMIPLEVDVSASSEGDCYGGDQQLPQLAEEEEAAAAQPTCNEALSRSLALENMPAPPRADLVRHKSDGAAADFRRQSMMSMKSSGSGGPSQNASDRPSIRKTKSANAAVDGSAATHAMPTEHTPIGQSIRNFFTVPEDLDITKLPKEQVEARRNSRNPLSALQRAVSKSNDSDYPRRHRRLGMELPLDGDGIFIGELLPAVGQTQVQPIETKHRTNRKQNDEKRGDRKPSRRSSHKH